MEHYDKKDAKLSYEELEKQNSLIQSQLKELQNKLDYTNFVTDISQKDNNIGTWEVDVKQGTQIWSLNYCKLLGYEDKIAEPSEDLFYSHVYPEDLELVKETMARSISSKVPSSLEFRFIRKDGSVGYSKSTANYLFNDKGEIDKIVGVFQDITQQKETITQLAESEKKFKSLFENIEEGVALHKMIFDSNDEVVDFIWIDVNPKYEKITQLKKEDIIGKKGKDVIPNIEKKWYDLYTRVTKTGKPETQIDHSEYLNKYWEVKAFCPKEGHFAVAMSDVSKRVISEQNLIKEKQRAEENELKFRALYDNSPDMYVSVSSETSEILLCNNTFLEKTGYTKEEIIGKSVLDIYHAESISLAKKAVKESLEQGKVNDKELILSKKGGGKIFVSLNINSIKDKNGKVHYIMSSWRDITNRKKQELVLDRNAKLQFDAQKLAKLGYWVYDIKDQIFEAADINYEMHNVHPNPTAKEVQKRIHPEDIDHYKEKFYGWMKGKSSGDLEYRVIHSDGSIRHIYATGQVEKDENGNIIRLMGSAQDVTNAKRVEQELILSEKRFRTIIENIPVFIDALDENGKAILWNKECEKVFGWKKDELNSLDGPLKLLYPDKNTQKELFEKMLSKPGSPFSEWEPITKNGKKIPSLWSSFKVSDEYNINIGYDISEQKEREKEILHSKEIAEQNEEKYKGLLSTMMNAFALHEMIYDADGKPYDYRFIEVNPAWEEIVGINKEIVIGKTIREIMPDIEQSWIDLYGRVTKTGIAEDFIDYNKSTGKYFHVYAYRPDQGKFAVFFNDITQKKIAEEKVKLNESRLSALVEMNQMTDESFENIHDFILQKAIDLTQSKIGFLCFVSDDESEMEIYKWSETVMDGCKVEDTSMIFKVQDAGIWANVIIDREPIVINDYSKAIKNKKGIPPGHVQISNYLSVPSYRNNKIVALASVANKDIDYTQSDVDQLTLLLDGMRRFLEQKSEKEELIEAKRKAEESDRLKTAFLANMSHEIRTPMNGIVGFTELLQAPNLTSETQKRYAKIIQKSSTRLLNTVNDIIEISEIESGSVQIKENLVDITEQLNNLVDFFKPECENKGLKISIENKNIDGRILLNTDKSKINSIFSNLIKNSIKYTDEGYIKTGFRLDENKLIFYCEDSGIGIPKDRIDAIFNPFEQADIEDKNALQGSGLGLSIVKSYVEMLDGEIRVESEEGKGSCFYITFAYESKFTDDHEISGHPKPSIKLIEDISALIVEDNEVNSMHLSLITESLFKSIDIVDGGIKAIEFVKANPTLDVILMDIKMPGMDGFEATRHIREFNKDIVIIAQTAYAFHEDKQRMLDAGCNDVISKPIRKDTLVQILNKFFPDA